MRSVIEAFLQKRGLTLSQKKTKITHIADGFDFLGVNIRKYNGKLLIKPAKANVKAFLKKIRLIVKGNKALNQGKLISQLNPIIRGWANYHQHWVSSQTFHDVDHQIFKVLWQWSKRRHSKRKGLRWIKKRYFKTRGSRQWVFAQNDKPLFRASEVAITR